jgi:hypothetical protein
MRKRMLTALLAGSLLGVMAFGAIGSGAWFTDTVTTPTNTAASAFLDIESPYATPFSVTGLLPGEWTEPFVFAVRNEPGSTEVKYRFYDEKVSTDPGFYNQIQVRVGHSNPVQNPPNWCDTNLIWEGPLKDLDINSVDDAIVDTLGSNITHDYQLCFGLPTTVGNEYQSNTASFNLVAVATQPDNPGWSE